MNIAKKFVDALKEKKKTSPYDTTAQIKRIEGNTAWVHIPGGVDETPVKMTINASVGETVQVRVANGTAFLVGNASAPPTDDTYAAKVDNKVNSTNKILKVVQTAVEEVARIAGNTNQYFWHTETGTDTGAHITEVPQEDFLADPTHGGGNLLARSNGIAVRDGLKELSTFSASGLHVSSYTSGGIPVEIAHLGYGPGNDDVGGQSDAPYYTLGTRLSGYTIGNYSVAEGFESVANGYSSHAEGVWSESRGRVSHAEGAETIASGDFAHAEGEFSKAIGIDSHAQNSSTIAQGKSQTATGKFNKAQGTSTSIANTDHSFIIGNGTAENARSNALAVDWSGNVFANSELYANCASDSTGGNKVYHEGNLIPVVDRWSPADASVASGTTAVLLGSFTVPAGILTLSVCVRFAQNTSGYRRIYLAGSAGGASGGALFESIVAPVAGIKTDARFTVPVHYTSDHTFYLYAVQTSGSTLTATPRAIWGGFKF